MVGAIQSALPAIISGVTLVLLGAFGRAITGSIRGFESDFHLLKRSQKNQIKSDIKRMHTLSQDRGYITYHDLEIVMEQFEDYKALGGNSFVESIVDDMSSMEKRDR